MDVTTVKEQVTSNSNPEENTEWHNNGSQKVPGNTEDCENPPYHDMQHEEDGYQEKGENNQDNVTVNIEEDLMSEHKLCLVLPKILMKPI